MRGLAEMGGTVVLSFLTLGLGMEAESAAVLMNWSLYVSHTLKLYLVLMADSFPWSLAFRGLSQCLGVESREHSR